MKTRILVGAILVALGAASAFAQTTAGTAQRDVNQQTRIENGLKDGSLSTKEAGRREREQSQLDRLQAKDLKDGKLSPKERAQLRSAQDKSNHNIKAAKSNGVKGNPESKSSERMQADVQRNVNQEKRIEQGVQLDRAGAGFHRLCLGESVSGNGKHRQSGRGTKNGAAVEHDGPLRARRGKH